jgi:hypothetical protein
VEVRLAERAVAGRRGPRLGFAYEGRFRQAVVYRERNRDTDWYSIVDTEWPAIATAFRAWLDPANFDDDGAQQRSLAARRAR